MIGVWTRNQAAASSPRFAQPVCAGDTPDVELPGLPPIAIVSRGPWSHEPEGHLLRRHIVGSMQDTSSSSAGEKGLAHRSPSASWHSLCPESFAERPADLCATKPRD